MNRRAAPAEAHQHQEEPMITTTPAYCAIIEEDNDLSAADIVTIDQALAEPAIALSAVHLDYFLALIGGEIGLAAFLAIQPLSED